MEGDKGVSLFLVNSVKVKNEKLKDKLTFHFSLFTSKYIPPTNLPPEKF